MKFINKKTFVDETKNRSDFQGCYFYGLDLSDIVLKDYDFANSIFEKVKFNNADLTGCNFFHCLYKEVSFENAILKNTNLSECDLKRCNLSKSDVSGANFYFAVLEKAKLDQMIYDENTKYFALLCPEKGAFIGYKKCCDYRMVQLLIPSDAKRTSATTEACRCSKAKVLSITNFENTKMYREAVALADEDFIYRVGQWVNVDNFDEDRWNDGSRGIHFYLTRQEAIDY